MDDKGGKGANGGEPPAPRERAPLPEGAPVAYEGRHPVGDCLAEKAIELIGEHLVAAVKDGSNKPARDEMAGLAGTDDEARFLASSGRQSFASLRSGHPIRLPPPSKEWERDLSDAADPLRRSRVSFVALKTPDPASRWPEYTRKNASWPTNGSVMILKTRAANGPSSFGSRTSSAPTSSWPLMAGTSRGDGR